ncbi:MAG: glycosyltransferase family 39 protein [candidate division KSB1 bacterium]|nr:glycosyltransferase family 39 protein [candidate division KSB1 bacterium]
MAFTNMRLTRSKTAFFLFLALFIGSTIRFVYIARLDPGVHWPDEQDFMTLAENLAHGRGFALEGEPTAFRAPGYPLFLAPWSWLSAWSATLIRALHVFLNLLIMILVFILTRRFFSKIAALLAVWIIAFYPYYIFLTGTVLSELWFILLLLGSTFLLCLYRDQPLRSLLFAAGILMGTAVLTRPSAVILAAAAMLWLFTVVKKQYRKVIPLFVLGMIVIVLPWMARNRIVMGRCSITLNGGRNLWLGNNPETTVNSGSDIDLPPELKAKMYSSSEVKADSIYKTQAFSFIREHPMHTAGLWLQKGLALWRPGPSPTTGGYTKRGTCIRLASYLSYGPVFMLAVLSWFWADRRKRGIIRLWIYYAAGFTVLHAMFITKVRFRLPLDVFLIILAAYAAVRIYEKYRIGPLE